MNLSTPKNNKAEILHTMIKKGSVSIRDFPHLSGFRTRISELTNNDGIPMLHVNFKGINKFGNSYTYKEHILPADKKQFAAEIYETINTKN